MSKKPAKNVGENNGSAKLTVQQVQEIRIRLVTTEDYDDEIAADYGVSKSAVNSLRRRETWQFLPWPVIDESKIVKEKTRPKRVQGFLAVDVVLSIKQDIVYGMKHSEIAEKYKVRPGVIERIAREERYRNVAWPKKKPAYVPTVSAQDEYHRLRVPV